MFHTTLTQAVNAAHIAELHRQAALSRDVAAARRGRRRLLPAAFLPVALRRLRPGGSTRTVVAAREEPLVRPCLESSGS